MPNLEKIKTILRLQEELKAQHSAEHLQAFQKRAAVLLRQWVIEHLANGHGHVGQMFQSFEKVEITPRNMVSKQEYLAYMAKNGNWGTDLEARALSEILGLPLITYFRNGTGAWTSAFHDEKNASSNAIKLYYHADDHSETRPAHWNLSQNYDDVILADGNCLFNAFAVEVARIAPLVQVTRPTQTEKHPTHQLPTAGIVVTPSQTQATPISTVPSAVTASSSMPQTVSNPVTSTEPTPTASTPKAAAITPTSPLNIAKIIESQERELARIRSAFFKSRPSAPIATSVNAEPRHTKPKTTEELEQIRKDYEFALKLAAEELHPKSRL
jgi:hypothetical protein